MRVDHKHSLSSISAMRDQEVNYLLDLANHEPAAKIHGSRIVSIPLKVGVPHWWSFPRDSARSYVRLADGCEEGLSC